MSSDVLEAGARNPGLSLANALKDLGLSAAALERARGVGGQCATHRIDGAALDHGAPFLNGNDPELVAALNSVVAATPRPGWPGRVGNGYSCPPDVFRNAALLAHRSVVRDPTRCRTPLLAWVGDGCPAV